MQFNKRHLRYAHWLDRLAFICLGACLALGVLVGLSDQNSLMPLVFPLLFIALGGFAGAIQGATRCRMRAYRID